MTQTRYSVGEGSIKITTHDNGFFSVETTAPGTERRSVVFDNVADVKAEVSSFTQSQSVQLEEAIEASLTK